MNTNDEQLGYINVPDDYDNFTEEDKIKVLDKLLDSLYLHVDGMLDKHRSRIKFLDEVLRSTLATNEQIENYEFCSIIRDCIKRLNEE